MERNMFGAILRMRNLLLSFDEFKGNEGITQRDLQDYLGRYQDLRDEWKRRRRESTDITDDVMHEWYSYVMEQRTHDLDKIIMEERLKPEDIRKFMENAFRDGEIKTSGTDIDKLMPPVSRFGGGGRARKKQGVIDKLRMFFEKYFGIGGSAVFTRQEQKGVVYSFSGSLAG